MNISEIQDELQLYYNIKLTYEEINNTINQLKNINNETPDDDFIIFYLIYKTNPSIINDKTKEYIKQYVKTYNTNIIITMYQAFTNLALNCETYEIFCEKLNFNISNNDENNENKYNHEEIEININDNNENNNSIYDDIIN
jgi:hypothetical protein